MIVGFPDTFIGIAPISCRIWFNLSTSSCAEECSIATQFNLKKSFILSNIFMLSHTFLGKCRRIVSGRPKCTTNEQVIKLQSGIIGRSAPFYSVWSLATNRTWYENSFSCSEEEKNFSSSELLKSHYRSSLLNKIGGAFWGAHKWCIFRCPLTPRQALKLPFLYHTSVSG